MTPDLSALTKDEAEALEQIAQAAIAKFMNDAHEARRRQDGGGFWNEQRDADLVRALRLETAARRFQAAANRRARAAARDECVAVRVIEAFASAAVDELKMGEAA